jgi:hypothetical protein
VKRYLRSYLARHHCIDQDESRQYHDDHFVQTDKNHDLLGAFVVVVVVLVLPASLFEL